MKPAIQFAHQAIVSTVLRHFVHNAFVCLFVYSCKVS